MIRSAFLILAVASLAPLQAVADPPTAHLPMAFEAIIAAGDTLDSVLGHAGVPPTIRAEAALALSGVYDPVSYTHLDVYKRQALPLPRKYLNLAVLRRDRNAQGNFVATARIEFVV